MDLLKKEVVPTLSHSTSSRQETYEWLPEDVEHAYPLTEMQKLLLKEYELALPGSGVYHCLNRYHFRDDRFSQDAFEAALNKSVQETPALRTYLVEQAGRVFQAVSRTLKPNLKIVNLRHLPPAEQDPYIDSQLREDLHRPFKVGDRAPLCRIWLFLRSPEEFEFAASLHHAVVDASGHIKLVERFLRDYEAFRDGVPLQEERPLLGRNQARERLSAEEQALKEDPGATAYWQKTLDSLPRPKLPEVAEKVKQVSPLDGSLPQATAKFLVDLDRKDPGKAEVVVLEAYLRALDEVLGGPSVVGKVTDIKACGVRENPSEIGLFWNMVPIGGLLPVSPAERRRTLERRLTEMEPYTAFPLASLMEMAQGRRLFHATLNFRTFLEKIEVPALRAFEFINMKIMDRYHFPLNLAVGEHPVLPGMHFRFEYDPRFLNRALVCKLEGAFLSALSEVTAY